MTPASFGFTTKNLSQKTFRSF